VVLALRLGADAAVDAYRDFVEAAFSSRPRESMRYSLFFSWQRRLRSENVLTRCVKAGRSRSHTALSLRRLEKWRGVFEIVGYERKSRCQRV